ncbi:MAG: branched-chain-amino-acid transaminase [Sedimentisphaerales bacterium]|nr:branched-chain-amino-acid transaminase [Sedimentisphaerales bacterium]MBN2843376.1 branched-chain-amino-acid transaminase [Sedimentisphaerales bacterium]
MSLKIWLGDKLVDQENAMVSVFDHGLLYGDGVFEGTRVYNGKVFEIDAHVNRLYVSAKSLRLNIPMTREQLKEATVKTVEANGITDGYIRTIITRGVGSLGLNPLSCKTPLVIIIASTIQLYPKELYQNGLKVISANTVRNHPLSLPPQVKSLNYLNNIFAKLEALDRGMLEAIMYNHMGFVAEATGDNVFIVKDGVIFTPPVSSGSLDGITRQVVIKLARENGYEVIEKDLVKFDLHTADEFFLTGTAAEVIPVVEIDAHLVNDGKPGPITKQLMAAFDKYARS